MEDWQARAMALSANYYSFHIEIGDSFIIYLFKAATEHLLLKRNPEPLRKQQFQGSLVPY